MTLADPLNLARIPAGEFPMGTPDAEADEQPVHRVYVSEFFVSRYPVTQDEYARFVRATGRPVPAIRALPLIAGNGREDEFRQLAEPYVWDPDGRPPSGRGSHPVVLVTYEDAVAFCQWMSGELDRAVRLPTEAEWEKAARGGAEGQRYPWGNDIDPSKGNFLGDASAKAQRGTRPTGMFPPNAYGLYDVVGNVWEWVSDWYAEDYYSISASRDPRGPDAGAFRIVRGGSWVNADVNMLRCGYRHKVPPDTYAHSIGFRVVCEL
ncbi:MAG: formylglycine-generating enzyme family protein [Betaproteobacteria bacterium]